MKRTISVRAAATGAAAALAFTGLGMSAAFGAAVDPAKDHADVSGISTDTGSLNIHKFTPTTGASTNGNGTKIADPATSLPGAKPIEGITFKAWKINTADIKTNAAWEKIQAVADNFNNATTAEAKKAVLTGAGFSLEEVTAGGEHKTDASGATTFSDLPVGFYYVEEVTPAAGSTYKVHDGSEVKDVDGSKITPALPFIVSVPLTNPDNRTEWLYDVHVYPKNKITDNEKSVKDEPAHGSGNDADSSNLVYTIKTDLPGGVDAYQSYKVVDPLHEKLSYVGDSSTSKDVVKAIDKDGADVETFATPADYTITKSGDGDRTVTLAFTSDGLTKLITARNSGAVKLQWELHARVGDTVGKTDIPNTAYQMPPNEADPQWDKETNPGNPTNEVISKYGKVIVTKVKEDGSTGLDGAKFELYVCNESGVLGEKVSVDGASDWTSAAGGTITIDGLRLNNWMNASPKDEGLINPATEFYCLKEVEAPADYELLPNPIRFQLLTTSTVASEEYTQGVRVKNVPKNGGPELPVTGGQGIALLVTAGGLLVAGSVAYTVAASRKRKQQA